MNTKEGVLLIDIDSLIYYEAYKEKLEWAIQGIDERMARIFSETGTNKYIAFLTEGKCFRYDRAKSSEYKGARKGKAKPMWFNTLKAYLKAKYGAISIDGLEADDAVAFFTTEFTNATICSPDKDVLYQCVGKHYNYQMVKGDNPGEFHSKGFITTTPDSAENFLRTQLIMGDSTDGISGIEGVGPKTAEKWLESWKLNANIDIEILRKYIEKYGQVEGINRFGETFKLVYLLKTNEDMIREIGSIPEIPEIQEYIVEQEDTKDEVSW